MAKVMGNSKVSGETTKKSNYSKIKSLIDDVRFDIDNGFSKSAESNALDLYIAIHDDNRESEVVD